MSGRLGKGMVLLIAFLATSLTAHAQVQRVRVTGHVPAAAIAKAEHLGRLAANETVTLVLPMKLHNIADLQDLIRRQSAADDPLYGKFLTPAQFTAAYAPSMAEYESVAAEMTAQGFTVTARHDNRLLLELQASSSAAEQALGLELHRYRAADGRIVRAPTADPALPAHTAALVEGVAGLSGFAKPRAHFKEKMHSAR